PLLGVQTYLAGAHGQRRIPGQSVNLAHLIWRKPCAPVPLFRCTPGGFPRGAIGAGGCKAPSPPLADIGACAETPLAGKRSRRD
ncbi:MAG: hypothetical protein O9270_16550, partial [Aquidulcibacter sp.]|uniref:hypothetical protein n=1 Tax=Aquidulcibacter sp. TaxID=2052990 RepID=UPI0022BF318B